MKSYLNIPKKGKNKIDFAESKLLEVRDNRREIAAQKSII
jgi:hypothetical protein